jgi:hypothetical protein
MENKVITFDYSSNPPRKRIRANPSAPSTTSRFSSEDKRRRERRREEESSSRREREEEAEGEETMTRERRYAEERRRRGGRGGRYTEEGESKEEKKRGEDEKSIDRACAAEIIARATTTTVDTLTPNVDDAPEWVPTPLQPIDWVAIDAKEEATTDPSFCFLCMFSQSTADGTNPYFTELTDYITLNQSKMDLMLFLEDIQMIYNTHLRKSLIMGEDEEGKEKPKPPWYKSMIYKHLLHHAPTRSFMLEINLKRTIMIQQQICDSGVLLRDVKSGRTTVDKAAVNSFCKIVELGEKLLHNRVTQPTHI